MERSRHLLLNAITSSVFIKNENITELSPMWIISLGVFLCPKCSGVIYLTMLTIMEVVEIIGAGGGIATTSYLIV